jgi:hypothetical protein
MSKAFAWRPLALLPILKASACIETDRDWLVNRRLDLYHRSMDHVIADLNELCSKDMHLRFADDRIRLSRAFYHVLVLDGAEVAAATMCDTRQCPVCTCPHDELDRTDVAYPYRHSEEVKAKVEAARREHLDEEGRVKDRHQSKVSISYTTSNTTSNNISYTMSYTTSWAYFVFDSGSRGAAATQAQANARKCLFQSQEFRSHCVCAEGRAPSIPNRSLW